MPGLDELADGFNDGTLDTAVRWSGSCGDPDETAGRARVPCTTGFAGLKSASTYTLTGNGAALRLYAPTPDTATTSAASVLVLSSVGGTDAGFIVDPAQNAVGVYLREGYADGAAVFLTYSATDHAWLRIREDAGTLHWETSPDGTTWTTRRTAATPAWAADPDLAFLVEGHRDAGAADFIEVDYFNVPPGQTLALGTATVTETAQALGRAKTKALAAAAEADTAQALTATITRLDVTLTLSAPRTDWEVSAPW
ncbi:hypothetical protein AVW11_03975 [Streptomyces amritsarensis]|uniref:Uncharacterized protein n=1 Tax=Streptomyces amritsarensis TaxID=681158 RepID=A0ABX3G8U2_9ACTN|nr:hypothetical protein [Streptomyces amritsarensis]OLZ72559.1 hypothetical protein AVW11_03975 [Streptomyces amritsarensis]